MDKDTRLALVHIAEVSHLTMQDASDARILSLRIHDALLKARVPGYVEAYEAGDNHLLRKLIDVKDNLSQLVSAGIQSLKQLF